MQGQFHRASTKISKPEQNDAYKKNVTSQNTMSHVPFVTGILLLFVKQKSVEDFVRLIKLLY